MPHVWDQTAVWRYNATDKRLRKSITSQVSYHTSGTKTAVWRYSTSGPAPHVWDQTAVWRRYVHHLTCMNPLWKHWKGAVISFVSPRLDVDILISSYYIYVDDQLYVHSFIRDPISYTYVLRRLVVNRCLLSHSFSFKTMVRVYISYTNLPQSYRSTGIQL